MLTYPLWNNEWHAYYEDVPRDPERANYNQLTPMETARYILDQENSDAVDPQWRAHIPALIEWVSQHFGRGPFWGVQGVDEQTMCRGTGYGLGSDTACWASINARLYELAGDTHYKDNAFRAFNLAMYFASKRGVVASVLGDPLVSSPIGTWFSDSYADYIKHFVYGLGAVPEWSPPREDHLIWPSSVVQSISYAPLNISYRTFDQRATDVLRLSYISTQVTEDDSMLQQEQDGRQEGWVYDSATGILRIRHDHGSRIVVRGDETPTPIATPSPYPLNRPLPSTTCPT